MVVERPVLRVVRHNEDFEVGLVVRGLDVGEDRLGIDDVRDDVL